MQYIKLYGTNPNDTSPHVARFPRKPPHAIGYTEKAVPVFHNVPDERIWELAQQATSFDHLALLVQREGNPRTK